MIAKVKQLPRRRQVKQSDTWDLASLAQGAHRGLTVKVVCQTPGEFVNRAVAKADLTKEGLELVQAGTLRPDQVGQYVADGMDKLVRNGPTEIG